MSITHRKPQQQTLSIRISEPLREYLEQAKEFVTDFRGEAVSISDVAKLLLESAKQDRLDFRLEAAELQQSPTASLLQVRKKWEQQHPMSRAEWVLLALYVQVACEELAGSLAIPNPDSFIAVLAALLAVRCLRTDRGGGLDHIYLGNLGIPVATVFSERQFDPGLLPNVVGDLIQDLRHAASTPKDVVFAGRNLYVALRDESVIDVVALNRSLTPFLGTLFRLAARGHWIRERQPLRASWDLWRESANIEACSSGGFEVRECVTADGELELVLTMRARGIEYPIGPYPQIREFGAMLQQLQVGQPWDGLYFSASVNGSEVNGQEAIRFCRRTNGVLITLSEAECRCIRALFSMAMERLQTDSSLERLSLEYGEL